AGDYGAPDRGSAGDRAGEAPTHLWLSRGPRGPGCAAERDRAAVADRRAATLEADRGAGDRVGVVFFQRDAVRYGVTAAGHVDRGGESILSRDQSRRLRAH